MEKEEEIKKLDPQVETNAQAVTGQELSEEELESVAGGGEGFHVDFENYKKDETDNIVPNFSLPKMDPGLSVYPVLPININDF